MSKENNKVSKGWRTTAIVFMVLFLLETLFVGWIFSVGTESIEKENECSINVCEPYEAYYYDDYSEVCYCYEDNEIVYQKFIN